MCVKFSEATHLSLYKHKKLEKNLMGEFQEVLTLISNKITAIQNDKIKRYQIIISSLLFLLSFNLWKFLKLSFPEISFFQSSSIKLFQLQVFNYLLSFLFLSILRYNCFFLFNEVRTYQKIKIKLQEPLHLLDYISSRIDFYWSKDRRFKSFILISIIFFLILFGSILWTIFINNNFFESLWVNWTFLADPGTHTNNKGLPHRVISFFMTIGGMIIFALVIGIVSDDLSAFVDKLREG